MKLLSGIAAAWRRFLSAAAPIEEECKPDAVGSEIPILELNKCTGQLAPAHGDKDWYCTFCKTISDPGDFCSNCGAQSRRAFAAALAAAPSTPVTPRCKCGAEELPAGSKAIEEYRGDTFVEHTALACASFSSIRKPPPRIAPKPPAVVQSQAQSRTRAPAPKPRKRSPKRGAPK